MKHLIVFVVIVCFGPGARPCEDHDHKVISSLDVPDDSVYQLRSTWVDQNNVSLHLSGLAGRPRFVAMVYTKCQTACPLLVQNIKTMISHLSKTTAAKVSVDLFSFDSDFETTASLKTFKSKYKLPENWSVYAGSKGSVAELAAALGIQYKKLPSGDYVHSNVIFFVNKDGEIIAKHEGLGGDNSDFIKKIESFL